MSVRLEEDLVHYVYAMLQGDEIDYIGKCAKSK